MGVAEWYSKHFTCVRPEVQFPPPKEGEERYVEELGIEMSFFKKGCNLVKNKHKKLFKY